MNKEWQSYREKGRVKEDYQYTEQHQECLQELLDYLDKALPDEITFNLLKNIFLVAATEEVSTRDSLLPQQYIRLCRILSPGAILVLNAAYQIVKEGQIKLGVDSHSARDWCQEIARKSGLDFIELVENYETELIKYNLISDRRHDDRSGISYGDHC